MSVDLIRRIPRLLLIPMLCGVACLKPAGIRNATLPTPAQGALHIINFDVGQADALLVIYGGKSLLIDCGSPMNDPLRASHRIPRRLDALLGSRHLDYFLITHYHQDHFGSPGRRQNQRQPSGIFSLIERDGVTIGTILDRGFWTLHKGNSQRNYERTLQTWLGNGTVANRRELHPGDTIDLGPGLEIDVVSSSANGLLDRVRSLYPTFIEQNPPSENDYSVGVKVTLGEFEMFSAGDLSGVNIVRRFGTRAESYNDIESHIAAEIGAIELYRVNHHGSRNSTNQCFADMLRPQVSVFSTGKNGYGHPDVAVYERLKRWGKVRITGGADKRSREVVAADIVGDDVEVVVEKSGARFWVNGEEFRSRSSEEEKALGVDLPTACTERTAAQPHPDNYEHLEGGSLD